MSASPNAYRTALSRARGLGAAKDGVNRFIAERATSIALVPLCLWAVCATVRVAPTGYEGAVAYLQSPVHAVLAILLVVVSAMHMEMGMRVIIEDYIHKHGSKISLMLLNAAVCWFAVVLGVVSILKIALTGSGE